jgi:hypothetical protein
MGQVKYDNSEVKEVNKVILNIGETPGNITK